MFIGEYNHNLDDKYRLTMPTKFREALGETFYMTKGFDDCIFVYTPDEWNLFTKKLEMNAMKKKENRRIQRYFIASASECSVDKQGRTVLSATLREFAGIDKDVIVLGVSNRVEIWSKEKWQIYNEADDLDISEIAEGLDDLDL